MDSCCVPYQDVTLSPLSGFSITIVEAKMYYGKEKPAYNLHKVSKTFPIIVDMPTK